ncbi:hypothetical protein N7490_003864 [Penicillium lividum]|nr:hypothetical protein N7490_003864 [Penicillium lividum]
MVMLTLAAAHGIGISSSFLTPEQIRNAILFGWVNQMLAVIAIGLGKVVIVLFILQLHGYNTPTRTCFFNARHKGSCGMKISLESVEEGNEYDFLDTFKAVSVLAQVLDLN